MLCTKSGIERKTASEKGKLESLFLIPVFFKDGSVSHSMDFEVDGALKTEI